MPGPKTNPRKTKFVKPRKEPLKKTPNPLAAAVAAIALKASTEVVELFETAYPETLKNPKLEELLQTVKGHLFERDYAAAFGTKEFLEAYVVRWSPSRALAYRSVFLELYPELKEVFRVGGRGGTTEVVCIGGGAGAELVGAAAAVKALLPTKEEAGEGGLRVTAIDSADWGEVVEPLVNAIGEGYLPAERYTAKCIHADILKPESLELIPEETRLVTMMFTTNELYTQSRGDTTKFLLSLAGRVKSGCLFMVLESAGSYSTVKVGEKTFNMEMLLEHTLMMQKNGKDEGDWELVLSDDSRWYRLPEGVEYPVDLENMRYLVRIFRRL